MTLAASSQRSQIIRSKFRSVLQLRIHQRYQKPSHPRPFSTSPASDPDPWISASDPAGASAPALPSAPSSLLFSPGGLLPEPEYRPWKTQKKEPKLKANLTYHQYMPPESRRESRAEPQAEGSVQPPSGPPLWKGTKSQLPPPRMKPTPFTPSPPGIPCPSPPPHKLELQTLKLEELTVSELRQQLRLRGLPVSGTKSMLLERMRGGNPARERPKPRREDSPAGGPWPRLRPKAQAAARRQGSSKPSPESHPPPRAKKTPVTASVGAPTRAQTAAPALTPSPAPASAALTLEEELQEAIRRAQLLPNRGIDDILEDQVEPEDPLPPIPLDFPGSLDVLSPSPDSEGLSSVFSSSFPSPANSPSPAPVGPTDSLDWLEALSGGPSLDCTPPAPSIFSADLSDSTGRRLWDLLGDPW
ncbi:MEF2-activating motif and SAP domain-containing transcriptional regulator isoform X2 [Erinaceus europaeus]|uniref:MEF2-activating motif and SAP domain-containing transcriptional regulator isoform X2 n=1 Tax=Erinaceus europaeus TaxID=9365 RepID=A0ABM3WU19_ERIEU|nr:MEF2-activating motif and SAP domain-containing transcriptional regulator isoform X2 [Erinaceus europaeus]